MIHIGVIHLNQIASHAWRGQCRHSHVIRTRKSRIGRHGDVSESFQSSRSLSLAHSLPLYAVRAVVVLAREVEITRVRNCRQLHSSEAYQKAKSWRSE